MHRFIVSEKSSSTDWDPSAKADILSRCEEKIGQLYRHRVSGPGSFIPDPVPQQSALYTCNSILVKHYPKLEFNTNSRAMNNVWHCPGIVDPDPQNYLQANEIIRDDKDLKIIPTHIGNSSRPKLKKTPDTRQGNDNVALSDKKPAPRKEASTSFGSNFGSNISTYESSTSFRSGQEQPGNYMRSEQWQQYGPGECTSQYNPGDNSYAPFQQPALGVPGTYDPNNWSNSGGFNTIGYQQPQFENQQLVQYPVGHQPVGPHSQYMINNSNYPCGQIENLQYPGGGLVHYPIVQDMPRFPGGPPPDQWYPQNEQNIQFPETVQYPLKQRSNLTRRLFLLDDPKNSQSKSNSPFVNPNLISLTGKEATYVKKSASPPSKQSVPNAGEQKLPISSSDDSINKLSAVVTPKITGIEELYPYNLVMQKLLQIKLKIRDIQLDDIRSYSIFKDLEHGPKMYSYAYLILHRMLWKKDQNEYKIYASEFVEKSLFNLLHETFHDLNETKFEAFAKQFLTNVSRIHEKIKYTFRYCPVCRRGKRTEMISDKEPSRTNSPKRTTGHSSLRKSRSPHNRSNRSPLPRGRSRSPHNRSNRSPLPRGRSRSPHNRSNRSPHNRPRLRSRSPLKKRQLYYKSPPPKKTSSKSPTHDSLQDVSKDGVGSSDKDKSLSPHRQRLSNRLGKRRRDSRSRDRKDRSRRRSRHRRSSSINTHRMDSKLQKEIIVNSAEGDRSDNKENKSAESPEVEAIAVIKLPSKNIEVIDLVEEEIIDVEDSWISYDSASPESEQDRTSKINISLRETTGKNLDSTESSNKGIENQIAQAVDSDVKKQENNLQKETTDTGQQAQIGNTSCQKSEENFVQKEDVLLPKQELEEGKENASINKTESSLQKDEDSSQNQEVKPEKENFEKQVQMEEERMQKEEKEEQNVQKITEEIAHVKEGKEEDNTSALKQESEDEDKAQIGTADSTEEKGKILQTNITEKKEEIKENNENINIQENKPPAKLDFKTRVRNIQLENNELNEIIDCIEGNKKDKSVDPSYLMKGGMLCKTCQIGANNEVRIVATNEQINRFVFAVHTMSSSHASLQKTLILFNKHFIPMPDTDKVVEEVVNKCQICM